MHDQGTRVDIGALAADLQLEAAGRLARAVVCSLDSLEAKDEALFQNQKVELVEQALIEFDGTEAQAARTLEATLEAEGIAT
jgi:hypothetical protein